MNNQPPSIKMNPCCEFITQLRKDNIYYKNVADKKGIFIKKEKWKKINQYRKAGDINEKYRIFAGS